MNIKEDDASEKIVIVSYTTFPSMAPRSMRTNELAKELARQGHDVTLYVLTGGYDYKDYQAQTKIKVKDLGRTFLFKFNHNSGVSVNIFVRILNKLVGKFFEFPYIELMLNVRNVLKKEQDINMLISITSTYPIHWGAALNQNCSKKKLKNTIWVADCGDPYMGNTFHKKPFYFKYVEKWFCRKADFISIPIEEAREAYYPEFSKKIRVIPQGFNFDNVDVTGNYSPNSVPTFIYAGTFYKQLRDPRPFFKYLETLKIDFKFIIYTKSLSLVEGYIKTLGCKVEVRDYIPRKELITEMSKADFLVNFENPTAKQSPSKLIDYALSKRPILSINTNTKLEYMLIDEFLSGNYEKKLSIKNIEDYDIKNVAGKFLSLLNEDSN